VRHARPLPYMSNARDLAIEASPSLRLHAKLEDCPDPRFEMARPIRSTIRWSPESLDLSLFQL